MELRQRRFLNCPGIPRWQTAFVTVRGTDIFAIKKACRTSVAIASSIWCSRAILFDLTLHFRQGALDRWCITPLVHGNRPLSFLALFQQIRVLTLYYRHSCPSRSFTFAIAVSQLIYDFPPFFYSLLFGLSGTIFEWISILSRVVTFANNTHFRWIIFVDNSEA